MMRLLLPLVCASALYGQLAIFTLNGGGEIPLGTSYDFGRVAQGDSKDVRFRLRNISSTLPLRIFRATTAGGGFQPVDRRSLPFDIAPGAFQDLYIRFQAGTPATYNSSLLVNDTVTALLGTSVASAALSVASGCTLSGTMVDFGRMEISQPRTCVFALANPTAEPLTVSNFRLTGQGFQGVSDIRAPFTMPARGSMQFSVSFVPPGRGDFTGVLTIDARSYTLSATAVEPALQRPILEFDRAAPQSGEQIRLTVRLPSPAATAASGYVSVAFASSVPEAPTDSTILFASTGTRTLPFTVRAGETQVLLAGQPSAVVQTGSTAGRFVFTLNGVSQGINGDPSVSFTVPPQTVRIDQAAAVRRSGGISIQLSGFDNTYSMGGMSFQFYDRGGNVMANVQADFTPQFRSFFASDSVGSTFRVSIQFPVSGDAGSIGAAEVTLQNAAGIVNTQRLTIP